MRKHWALFVSIALFALVVLFPGADGMTPLFCISGMFLFFYWLVKAIPPVRNTEKWQKSYSNDLTKTKPAMNNPDNQKSKAKNLSSAVTSAQKNAPKDFELESRELLSQLPEELRVFLPDTDKFLLRKFETGGTPFVSYTARIEHATKGEDDRRCRREVFLKSQHPFLGQYMDDPAQSVEDLLAYLIYSPSYFKASAFKLEVQLDSGYWDSIFVETADSLAYNERSQESYHDGGGSHSFIWTLYKTEKAEPELPLLHDEEYKQLRMPPCKGFWIKDDRCYIVDPWSIPGVFELYMRSRYLDWYGGEEEVHELGLWRGQKKE